ncbi:hypothetical protein RRG08_046979 [Elysia crispata]|uniref:Uncharacterized protein n=1 Tax=Elysia crispata TaxID=231223 RepID=A0AAE1A8E3_9GAST|nr:hypothetical protein RRG08_046979 [Elysia crispata]
MIILRKSLLRMFVVSFQILRPKTNVLLQPPPLITCRCVDGNAPGTRLAGNQPISASHINCFLFGFLETASLVFCHTLNLLKPILSLFIDIPICWAECF